jgi:hypothetical protein
VILTVRPLLFIAVKKETADVLINGRAKNHEISYQTELDLCAEVAKRNVHLWNSLLNLPRPARLSHTSIHYLFNAALTLQLYQILVEGQAQVDYEEVGFVISVLDADESTNREYARDCSNVLRDLGSLMGRLRSVDVSKAATDGQVSRGKAVTLHPFTPGMSSPSEDTGTTSAAGSLKQYDDSHEITDDLRSAHVASSKVESRENAYHELLSWLHTDELQQKFDFPHRLG